MSGEEVGKDVLPLLSVLGPLPTVPVVSWLHEHVGVCPMRVQICTFVILLRSTYILRPTR